MKRNKQIITIFKEDDSLEERVIYELTKKERSTHRSNKDEYLGLAYGQDLGHCLYLGMRFCPNFLNKVTHYYHSIGDKGYQSEFYKIDHLENEKK